MATPLDAPMDQPARPTASRSTMDIRSLGNALVRRWKLFVTIAGFVTAAMVAVTLLLTPVWSATTQIRIEANRRSPVDFEAAAMGGPPDQAIVDTEVNLMRSREVARRVVDQLGLVNDREFNRPSVVAATPSEQIERTIDSVLEQVGAGRSGTTYLVGLTARSVDPRKAARIANAFADQYIRSSIETQVGTATEQSSTLRGQLARLGAEVQAADAQVAQYRARAGIVQGGTNGTITDQQVAPLSSQLATAEAQAAAARSNAAAARAQIAKGGFDAVSGVLNSAVIGELRRQRAEVLRRQGEVVVRYGPRHPESRSLSEQLEGVDKQLREESERIVSGIDSDARAASASAASLRGELVRLRGQQAGDTRAAVVAESLERQAEAKRTVYNQLAQAAQQTAQQRQGTAPLGRIVEVAQPSLRPSFPNKPLFVVLGIIFGSILGLGAVVLAETFKMTLLSSDDVEQQLSIPFVASIKRLRRSERGARPWNYVVEKPMSAYSESFRAIRTSLLVRDDEAAKIIAVCSALPGEGKSTVATSLGRVMAMSGDRVVLIDCDLRRNALRALASSDRVGLVEVIDDLDKLDLALAKDDVSDLTVLQPMSAEFNARDLFGGAGMARLLDELGKRFSYILLDTPPILAVADSRTLVALADTVVFLVRWNATSRFAARSALERISSPHHRKLVGVLTMTEARAGMTSRSDPAFYSSAYAKYYQD